MTVETFKWEKDNSNDYAAGFFFGWCHYDNALKVRDEYEMKRCFMRFFEQFDSNFCIRKRERKRKKSISLERRLLLRRVEAIVLVELLSLFMVRQFWIDLTWTGAWAGNWMSATCLIAICSAVRWMNFAEEEHFMIDLNPYFHSTVRFCVFLTMENNKAAQIEESAFFLFFMLIFVTFFTLCLRLFFAFLLCTFL